MKIKVRKVLHSLYSLKSILDIVVFIRKVTIELVTMGCAVLILICLYMISCMLFDVFAYTPVEELEAWRVLWQV